jgi:hypothetical protein
VYAPIADVNCAYIKEKGLVARGSSAPEPWATPFAALPIGGTAPPGAGNCPYSRQGPGSWHQHRNENSRLRAARHQNDVGLGTSCHRCVASGSPVETQRPVRGLLQNRGLHRRAQGRSGRSSEPHVCVGLHLARLEMAAIFRALATRVRRFHIEEEVRNVHNVLRGFSKLLVSVE